jgi:hypothetical protein
MIAFSEVGDSRFSTKSNSLYIQPPAAVSQLVLLVTSIFVNVLSFFLSSCVDAGVVSLS